MALRDGWAVNAEDTRDAGPYAPLALQPSPQRCDAFAALPPGADAVASLDAVSVAGGIMQITVPLAPAEGVLPAGGDVEAGDILRGAGSRLRETDVAALAAAGAASVVIRQPRIRIVNTHGTQVLDTWAFNAADAAECMSMEHTRSVNSRIHPRTGDALVSIRRRPMLRLVADT